MLRIFRFIFKFVVPCLLFKWWLSLLFSKKNNEIDYEGVGKEKRKKDKKNHIQYQKMFGNKSFIYDVRIKKCIIRTQPPLPSLSANMQVWPEPTLFLETMFTVLIHIVKMTGK